MRTYRCFCDEGPLVPGALIELGEDERRHLATVKRVGAGAGVEIIDGAGVLATGEFESIERNGARIRVREIAVREERPLRELSLALALTRSDAFDDAIVRAVELGATQFAPLATDRAVVELDERRVEKRMERWHRLAVEALKQCERLWLPEILGPATLDERLDDLEESKMIGVALMERAGSVPPLVGLLGELATQSLRLFIGPEGGWSPRERELLESRARLASCGTAILRSETAALAALALASGL